MHHQDIWQTISVAVRRAVAEQAHLLSERALRRRVDQLLFRLPTTGRERITAALLLRRYRGALQHELCEQRRPRPLPASLEDQICELTRAVMVAVQRHVSFSVETAVFLALVIRAGGLEAWCQTEFAA